MLDPVLHHLYQAKQSAHWFAQLVQMDPDLMVPAALPLIAKFATPSLAGPMRRRYLNERWPCDEEEWFVTYFVRAFPATHGEGRRILDRKSVV